MRAGKAIEVRGEKTSSLLGHLALHYDAGISRDGLIEILWPDNDSALAAEALHSRIHSLQKALATSLDRTSPILFADGFYRLNRSAGIAVDVVRFDALVREGQQHARDGREIDAAVSFERAVGFYRGDLCIASDVHALVERERLRASYLTVLAWLADHCYVRRDHLHCLDYARRILSCDPYREDAHRSVMRCHVRLGERAQALHQYRLCKDILNSAFSAKPEPATTSLYDQIRLDPATI
jgi:DNA-binding SARP family transcriptional activator